MIPSALRYVLAVSRRTPVAASIRRRLHPSRPSVSTCCCLSSVKTLPIPAKDHLDPRLVNVPARLPHMAGFEATLYGRLWVITEARRHFGIAPSSGSFASDPAESSVMDRGRLD